MNAVAVATFFVGVSVGALIMGVIVLLMDTAEYYRRMRDGR